MADILKLVPKDGGPQEETLAGWLRALAEQVESGEMPSKAATIIFVIEDADEGTVCCRERRHGMHYLAAMGALQITVHDMLHAD